MATIPLFPPPKVITANYMADHGIRNGVEYFAPEVGTMAHLQSMYPWLRGKNPLTSRSVSSSSPKDIGLTVHRELGIGAGQNYESKDPSDKPAFPQIKTIEQAYGLVDRIMNSEAELDIKYKDGFGVSPKELVEVNHEIRQNWSELILENSDIRHRPLFPQIKSEEQAYEFADGLMREQRKINQKYIDGFGVSPEELAEIEKEYLEKLTRFILKNSGISYN